MKKIRERKVKEERKKELTCRVPRSLESHFNEEIIFLEEMISFLSNCYYSIVSRVFRVFVG